MKSNIFKKKRKFYPVEGKDNFIFDAGEIKFENNEQLTLLSPDNKKNEIVCKDWGYYITSSVNSRLAREGYKTAIIKNKLGRIFLIIVDKKKINYFLDYIKEENIDILDWLDEK